MNRYFVKKPDDEAYTDIETLFDGITVLSIDGFNEIGESVNVYHEQWTDSQVEDFLVTTQDSQENDLIIRKNVDLSLTFIISRRYTNRLIDEQTVYNQFVSYLNSGDFYIKSLYANDEAHVICLDGFKPTSYKYNRGWGNYIIATVKLHTLNATSSTQQGDVKQQIYIGFSPMQMLYTMSDITGLTNVQHVTDDTIGGDYEIVNDGIKYLWICSTAKIKTDTVMAGQFYIPMDGIITKIGDFYCYRTYHRIRPHTMSFSITEL
jgi:hypothetical protein